MVATLLGVGEAEEQPEAPADTPAPRPRGQRNGLTPGRMAGRAMLKARVKAAQEGRPAPRWGPPSNTEQAALSPLLRFGGVTPV